MGSVKVKYHDGEYGFTLIEIIIVIAILGILALVALPNMSAFLHSGRVNAANTELTNVQHANQAYSVENHGTFAASSADLGNYINGGTAVLHGSYVFDPDTGAITGTPTSGYDGVTWNGSLHLFE